MADVVGYLANHARTLGGGPLRLVRLVAGRLWSATGRGVVWQRFDLVEGCCFGASCGGVLDERLDSCTMNEPHWFWCYVAMDRWVCGRGFYLFRAGCGCCIAAHAGLPNGCVVECTARYCWNGGDVDFVNTCNFLIASVGVDVAGGFIFRKFRFGWTGMDSVRIMLVCLDDVPFRLERRIFGARGREIQRVKF